MSAITGPHDLIARVHTFDWKAWREAFAEDFTPVYREGVKAAAEHHVEHPPRVRKAKGGSLAFDYDDPFLQHFMTEYVGQRIKQLEDTTRDDVIRIIRRTFDEPGDHSIAELRDEVLDAVRERFDGYEEWRATRIARTETGITFNHGTGLLAKQNGVDVDVVDGDEDEGCAAANGALWTAEEFLANPLEHPNCTRDGAPHIEDLGDDE
jgi:hypothetical protein